jgi:hypothetical protein
MFLITPPLPKSPLFGVGMKNSLREAPLSASDAADSVVS